MNQPKKADVTVQAFTSAVVPADSKGQVSFAAPSGEALRLLQQGVAEFQQQQAKSDSEQKTEPKEENQ